MEHAGVDPLLGRTIAEKYAIEELLGRGGMGAVYRARQVPLDMPVAVKVLRREMAADEDFVRRFHREAKAASSLNHPCSVRVLDFGEEPDGLLYIVMEHLAGRTLASLIDEPRIDERRLDEHRVARIVTSILAALARAHELGIIHRDLKPENVMILPGVDDDGCPVDLVKVCDFGIATTVNGGPTTGGPTTTTGLILGTPQYMSPEQARGEAVDARTDLYSVGAVLYELLTGEPPFHAAHALGIAVKLLNDPVRSPSAIAPGIDPDLERICVKALAKRREDRWSSAREMRAALRAFLTARGATIPPIPPSRSTPPVHLEESPSTQTPAPMAPRASRSRVAMAMILGAIVLGLAMLGKPSAEVVPKIDATPPSSKAEAFAVAQTTESIETPASSAAFAIPAPTVSEKVVPRTILPRKGPPIASAKAPLVTAVADVPIPEEPKPPPPAAAAPSVSAPPAPTVAIKPAFDASGATVTLGAITASGVSSGGVRAVLSHAPFARCYRDALVARGAPASGEARLHLLIDDTGRVSSATLSGATFLPSVRSCIEAAAKLVTVKDVDTGDATADVVLRFAVP